MVMFRLGWLGLQLARKSPDWMASAIGMGACSTVVGGLVVNMFGSRLGDLSVMAYVWLTLAVVSHLIVEMRADEAAKKAAEPPKKKRRLP
jgi:hypothetical protein